MQSPQDKKFRLHTALPKNPGLLRHEAPTLLVGSCFSSEVGLRLEHRGFPVTVNPFGTLFNPVGIFELLSGPDRQYFEGLNVQRDGRWVNYRMHSNVSGETGAGLSEAINLALANVQDLLPGCGLVVITFGTAWVWSLKGDARPLANLHKQLASLFERRLLAVNEIDAAFEGWYSGFRQKNPGAKAILTVSPVIHGRAELHENNLSKSVLLLACHAIRQRYPEVGYFPSYEIVRDELRDYRFFAEDMQHPSGAAADYVTECFLDSYADEATLRIAAEALAESKKAGHRPML